MTTSEPAPSDNEEDPSSLLRLVGYGAVIGVPAALLAAGFLAVVHEVEDWLWTDLPDALGADSPPWYLVVGLPLLGSLVVVAARKLLPGDGGHSPLLGISVAPVPWSHGLGIALAALGTLSFGAVLGPEAPLIALGSVVGMVVVDRFKVTGRGENVLATAGSFSAVSALFGGPLVAGILLLEGGLAAGAALVPALIPGLAAAAVGYVVFVGIGDWGGVAAQSLTVTGLPTYDGTHVVDLAVALVVGLVAAVVVLLARGLGARIEGWAAPRWEMALLMGGLAVGVIAQIAVVLGATHDQILFSGQAAVPSEIATTSVSMLLLLIVAKGLAYAVSLGSGFRGGPIFPAIFLGIAVASIAVDLFDISPTWAVAVGAAAGMAAGSRTVFSSLLFSTLLVGPAGADALPAAVVATISAWLAAAAIRDRLPHLDPSPSRPA